MKTEVQALGVSYIGGESVKLISSVPVRDRHDIVMEIRMVFEPSEVDEFNDQALSYFDLMAHHKSDFELVHRDYLDECRKLEKASHNKIKYCPYCGEKLEIKL